MSTNRVTQNKNEVEIKKASITADFKATSLIGRFSNQILKDLIDFQTDETLEVIIAIKMDAISRGERKKTF